MVHCSSIESAPKNLGGQKGELAEIRGAITQFARCRRDIEPIIAENPLDVRLVVRALPGNDYGKYS